jgi:hypothetical protein
MLATFGGRDTEPLGVDEIVGEIAGAQRFHTASRAGRPTRSIPVVWRGTGRPGWFARSTANPVQGVFFSTGKRNGV